MDFKLKNTKIYLRNFTDRVIKLLKDEITRSRVRTYKRNSSNYPINDTGSLANSIKRLRVKNTPDGFSYGVEGNSYAIPLNEKKGARKAPPIEEIISWIKRKRITLTDSKGKLVSVNDVNKVKSIAYVIGRSISANNVKPTGFINSAIEKSMADLSKLGESVGKDVLLNVDDILLKSGYIKKGDNYIIENGSK